MRKPQIENVVIIGDSLSDRGDMADDRLFGILPMDVLSGLSGKSPDGRFTNGLVWTDYFGLRFAQVSGFKQVDLDDPGRIKTETGNTIVRTFCKGGTTASNWSSRLTVNPVMMGTQQILLTLDELRDQLRQNDEAIGISVSEKEKTLVIEWSGANDLITVNTDPTLEDAQQAVAARVNNVRKMLAQGYRHFCLLNLPDLSLTPRFQAKEENERERIQEVTRFFNRKLSEEIAELQVQYPASHFHLYDANQTFTEAFNEPAEFELDDAKKRTPFTTSADFQESASDAAANGYMFWDDVHPTAQIHFVLANQLFDKLQEKFYLFAPRETLMKIFREHYGRTLESERHSCGGFFRRSNIKHTDINLTLEQILRHGLYEGGDRTRDVMRELGWIDSKNQLASKNPRLIDSMQAVHLRRETGLPGAAPLTS